MNTEEIIKKTAEATLAAAVPYFERMLKQASEAAAKAGARTGAKSAIDTIEKERKKLMREWYDRRLRNTKLLLQNYRPLMEHYESAIYDAATLDEEDITAAEVFELMTQYVYDNDLYVESIKKSAARTHIIMEHLNKMLGVYEVYCMKSQREDYKRHWRVISALYLAEEPTTAAKIAEDEKIDKRTVYKDIDTACEVLTALIFGVDGVRR
ncbi:hypothetical protein [Clostridium sp. D33t1_170424_F3]|uniref:hypothetical protein n=1 Tax=Clostridium sp. D33t1_170424_F3 TaxID=2787099 RepID=UPI0018AB4A46|nr:hypothetical protein [Clostridium sp. D33t1_170424_F3]